MAGKALSTPRIGRLTLPVLEAGDPEELRPHGRYDGASYTGGDLSGRVLDGIAFSECELVGIHAHEASFRNARFLDTRLERFNAPVLTAPGLVLRSAAIDGSRIGSAEAFSSQWNSVRISGSKVDFLNLRGSELRDVSFSDCVIGELDLSGAKLTRVSFEGTRIGTLVLDQVVLEHVDLRGAAIHGLSGVGFLRGATLSALQLEEMAAMLAAHLGIRVED